MKLYIIKFLLNRLTVSEKHNILTMAVKDLFNTVGHDDILQEKEGQWIANGKILPDGVKQALVAEANHMLESKLWRIIESDIKYQANLRMYEKSQSETDLIAGKLWLYTFDVIKTRLQSLAKKSAKFNR